MKVQVVRCGKLSQVSLLAVAAEYRKRLGAYFRTEDIEIKVDPSRDKRNPSKFKDSLYVPNPGEFLVLLDERGQSLDSQSFSRNFQSWIDDPSIKVLTFLIGPPYGFDDATRAAARVTWSLSPMTIPSDLAWLLCWEQIYRAVTIIKGTPYHHD